ncbi:MAG: hypothetical protein AAGD43_32775 [Pseudomonadota bacterium]
MAALLHHYKYESTRKLGTSKQGTSEAKLAAEFDITPAQFNNFLRQGATGNDDIVAQKISEGLFNIYIENGAIEAAPSYVRRVCAQAFDDDPDLSRLLNGDVGTVFDECSAGTSDKTRDAFNEHWTKVFDIYRYAARVIPTDPPTQETSADGSVKFTSNAVRAALQIYPPQKSQKYPRFELHYKPFKVDNIQPPLVAHGSCFVVGAYLYLIGKEDAHDRPLVLVCKFLNPSSAINFSGLVIRHHDGGGEAFCSRCYFQRNDTVESIADLKDELGVINEADLPDEIVEISTKFLNDTDFGGKGALLIKS